MKPIVLIKYLTGIVLMLAVGLAILSLIVPDIVPSKPTDSKRSYSQMSAYVAMLESFSLQSKSPLSCHVSREAGQNLQDQWNRDLRCSMDGASLYIRSAGPDGIFESKDDLVVRRLVRSSEKQ